MDSGLILLIISLAVGAFLNAKGKKTPPAKGSQSKPSTATESAPDSPTSKLKELYRELQKELQSEDVEAPSRQEQQERRQPQEQPQVVIQQPERPQRQPMVDPATLSPQLATTRSSFERKERGDSSRRQSGRPDSSIIRQSGRVATNANKNQSVSILEPLDLLPKSQDDLLKGIVFSEIFGPPKSKR